MKLPRILAALGLLLSAQALPAHEGHSHGLSSYTAGHSDIGVGWHDGELEIHFHIDEGSIFNGATLTESVEPDPDETLIIVSDAAKQTATAAIATGAGVAEGTPLWILPASNNPALPFLGFATEELNPADWNSDIHFKVKDVHSPSGSGHFSIYQSDGLGGFDFLAATALGGLTEDDKLSLPAGAHDHYFIAFSEPGLWEVTIQAEGEHGTEGSVESEEVTFLFHVGPFRWTAGHGDIGLAYEEGGELELHLHLHEGAVVNGVEQEADSEPPADQTVIVVSEAAQQAATAAIASGAGVSAGETVWILPTSPSAELPFVGFGTEELDPAEWESDLTFSLVNVTSPSGTGHFSVYQSDGLGGFDFLMSTALGGITEDDHLEMAAGTHDHFFMAFSESGLWAVTLKASGEHHDDGEVESDEVTFYFEVAEETAGRIALSQPAYTYNQGSTLATVTLNRTGAVSATSVTINTSNGTAQTTNPPFAAGVAGTDYTTLTAPATTVDFAEGETSKTVDIALLPRTGNVANTRFNVTLSNPTNDVSLGLASAEVRVLANDSMNPTVRIAAPAANASLSLAAPIETRGTAGDRNGISRVEVVLNGGAPIEAELDEGSRPTAVYWHADIVPTEGANTLQVTSFDMRGNASTIATRSFTFTRRWLLAVGRFELHHDDHDHAHDDHGHDHDHGGTGGHLDPGAEAGTLTLATLPRTAATALAPRDSHLQSSQILPGTLVALVAKAKPGYLFSYWEGVPEGANVQGAAIAFTMPAANVPRIRAVFAENPFFGLGARANFLGLLHPEHEDDETTVESVGYVTGTIVTSTGAFTGKVLIGGKTHPFVAAVYANGKVLFKHDSTFEPEFEFDGRHMSMDFHDGEFHVHIGGDHDDHHHGDLAGDEGDEEIHVAGTLLPAAFSKTNPVPSDLLNRASRSGGPVDQGFFTLSLPYETAALPDSAYPHGDGFANLTLSSDGKLRTVATLADGTKFTASTELVVEHHHDDHDDSLPADPGEHEDEDSIIAPLFAQLRTPGGGPKDLGGAFGGELAFDTHEEDSDVHGEDLVWIRPEVTQVAGTTAAARATQLYTAGWPEGIHVHAVGALYDASVSVQDSLGLGSSAPTGNGQLQFAAGKLASDVVVTDFNITGNTVAKLPPTNRAFNLSFTPNTGLFRGTFTPNWEDKARALPAFQGILIQKGNSKGGFGWFHSNRTGDLDPEAGGVSLGTQE